MSTSGKSTSADKRNRPARVAPRRHIEPAGQPAAGTYDSNEFPVLLRMPDVSRPILGMEPEEKVDARDEPPDSAPFDSAATRSPPATRRTRHSRVDTGSGRSSANFAREQRFTGKAAAQFWSKIPPQVAAGGMLLAVIALCFVLLRDSNPAAPSRNSGTEWSSGSPQGGGDNLANVPRAPVPVVPSAAPTDWPLEHSSVAAKPVPPLYSPPPPANQAPTGKIQEPMSSWPESTTNSVLTTPSAVDEVTPVHGWPDGLSDSADEQPTSINAPVESARRAAVPPIRTSQRTFRPEVTPSAMQPGMADSARLRGTIEIPPPTNMYRQ